MSADILIIDDEADIRMLIQGILEDEGFSTRQAGNAEQAYEAVAARVPSLVILDIWLQNSDHDGMNILQRLKADHPHLPVIMISGHGTIETAVSAIKLGAYDFIEKPFKSDRLLVMIDRALEAAQLKIENEALRRKVSTPADLTGTSTAVAQLRHVLERVGPTNSRVLITGEPGTGKELAARMIHRLSDRANSPFMSLNCATLLPERLEIELFGSIDGVQGEPGKVGVLEQANGGTLLLDEVSDMPLETQGKIVRALQDQKVTRVGGKDPVQVDVRILASTNRDLNRAMEEGHFRQDLYYRLNVVPLNMPPLRDRVTDIPDLAQTFMDQYADANTLPRRTLSDAAIMTLQAHRWPGNIRQLRNAMEWVMIMSAAGADEPVRPDHLPPEISGHGQDNSEARPTLSREMVLMPLREAREQFEKEYLEAQVERFNGNISKTAQFIGMERSALHRKLKLLCISTSDKPDEGDEVQGQKKTA